MVWRLTSYSVHRASSPGTPSANPPLAQRRRRSALTWAHSGMGEARSGRRAGAGMTGVLTGDNVRTFGQVSKLTRGDRVIVNQYYLECLSHASYLVGDETSGTAVVIDPRRDIAEYVADAEHLGLRITHVMETHLHADFLSGHLELAAATGADIVFGEAAPVEFEAVKLPDGALDRPRRRAPAGAGHPGPHSRVDLHHRLRVARGRRAGVRLHRRHAVHRRRRPARPARLGRPHGARTSAARSTDRCGRRS